MTEKNKTYSLNKDGLDFIEVYKAYFTAPQAVKEALYKGVLHEIIKPASILLKNEDLKTMHTILLKFEKYRETEADRIFRRFEEVAEELNGQNILLNCFVDKKRNCFIVRRMFGVKASQAEKMFPSHASSQPPVEGVNFRKTIGCFIALSAERRTNEFISMLNLGDYDAKVEYSPVYISDSGWLNSNIDVVIPIDTLNEKFKDKEFEAWIYQIARVLPVEP